MSRNRFVDDEADASSESEFTEYDAVDQWPDVQAACPRGPSDPMPLDPRLWIGHVLKHKGIIINRQNIKIDITDWAKKVSPEIVCDELHRSYTWCKDIFMTKHERPGNQTQTAIARWMGVKEDIAQQPSNVQKFLENIRNRLNACDLELRMIKREFSNHLTGAQGDTKKARRVQQRARSSRDHDGDDSANEDDDDHGEDNNAFQSGLRPASSSASGMNTTVEEQIDTYCNAIKKQMRWFVNQCELDHLAIQLMDTSNLKTVAKDAFCDKNESNIDGIMVTREIQVEGEKMKPTSTLLRVRDFMGKSVERDGILLDISGDVIIKSTLTQGVFPDGRCMCITNGKGAPDALIAFSKNEAGASPLYRFFPANGDTTSDHRCSLEDWCRAKVDKLRYPTIATLIQELRSSEPISGITKFLRDMPTFRDKRVKRDLNVFGFHNGILVYHARHPNRKMRSAMAGDDSLGFTFVEHTDFKGFQRLHERNILDPNAVPHRSFNCWFDRTILAMSSSEIYTPELDTLLTFQGYYKDHRVTNNILALLGLQLGPPRGGRNCTTILFGPGNTGKSLLLNTITYILPKYLQATLKLGKGKSDSFGETSLIGNLKEVKKGTAKPKVVSNLIVTEVPKTITMDDAFLKMAFEGKGTEVINIKNHDEVTVELDFNTLLATNSYICPDKNDGNTFGRRIIYVLMSNTVHDRDDGMEDKIRHNIGALIVLLNSKSAELLHEMGESGFLKKHLDPKLNAYTDSIVRHQSKVCCAIMAGIQSKFFLQGTSREVSVHSASIDAPAAAESDEDVVAAADASADADECWVPWSIFYEFVIAYVEEESKNRGKRCRKPSFSQIRAQINDFWNLPTTPYHIQIDAKHSTFNFMGRSYTDFKVRGIAPGPTLIKMYRNDNADVNRQCADDRDIDGADVIPQMLDLPDNAGADEQQSTDVFLQGLAKTDLVDPSGPAFGTEREDIDRKVSALRFLKQHKITKNTKIEKCFLIKDKEFYKSSKCHKRPSYLKKMIELFKRLSSEFRDFNVVDDDDDDDDDDDSFSQSDPDPRLEGGGDVDDLKNIRVPVQHPLVIAAQKSLALRSSGKPDWRSRRTSEEINENVHTSGEILHLSFCLIRDKIIRLDPKGLAYEALLRSRCILNTLAVARVGLDCLDTVLKDCKVLGDLSGLTLKNQSELRAYAHWGFLLKFCFGYQITGGVDIARADFIDMSLRSPSVVRWCKKLKHAQPRKYRLINDIVMHLAVGHLRSASTYCMVGGARELFYPLFNGLHATATALTSAFHVSGKESYASDRWSSDVHSPLLGGRSLETIMSLYKREIQRETGIKSVRSVHSGIGVLGTLLYHPTLKRCQNLKDFSDVLNYCRNAVRLHQRRSMHSREECKLPLSIRKSLSVLMGALMSNVACGSLRKDPQKDLMHMQLLKDPILTWITKSHTESLGMDDDARASLEEQLLFLNPYRFDVPGLLLDFLKGRTGNIEGLLRSDPLQDQGYIFWTQAAAHSKCRSIAELKRSVQSRDAPASSSSVSIPASSSSSAVAPMPSDTLVVRQETRKRPHSPVSLDTTATARKKSRSSNSLD